MEVIKTTSEMLEYTVSQRRSVGLVPTMGALHEGHLSLIRQSKSENVLSVCSIFVNPIQFNNPNDFAKYPNTLDNDMAMLENTGCDLVFAPSAKEMYQSLPLLKFDFGHLETVMEGAFRPGHFNGVAIVVSKLFHLTRPTVAYFGQKDLQQTLVVKRLVEDLGFPISLKICPTMREKDGLAMSSRNVRLTPALRSIAPILYQQLTLIRDGIQNRFAILDLKNKAMEVIEQLPTVKLEYLEIADAASLLPINDSYTGDVAICIAAYFDDVRLIDNIVFYKP